MAGSRGDLVGAWARGLNEFLPQRLRFTIPADAMRRRYRDTDRLRACVTWARSNLDFVEFTNPTGCRPVGYRSA